ncbi:SHOCT domain-containing protein [Paenibacillus albiflavus]|uniref:SHOCT domain-containing protein n=1 Tax=Paenibacillus albiflavus TaxID=2545760 RepID=A0A4R4EE71_9BACL|nr:SHOCT domain-containing protein [Paenibacillus albiflavus]TCZ76315.1 SHOCT domain-containing protein [Paenibacillus albiflavus]
MSPRRMFMVGTMAFTIALSAALWNNENINTLSSTDQTDSVTNQRDENGQADHIVAKDPLLQILGLSSDEEMYSALSNGQTLADIASDHEADIEQVIKLQTSQMTEQLDQRLASGSITAEVYEAQKAELASVITGSVYGQL